ncbi:hypothetical protein Plhal710r2_c010g0046211 [Plasmopara halstedii]
MMTASSGLEGASAGRYDDSIRLTSSQEAKNVANDVAGDEFGSFAAAELPSDPFGDVYGAETDFGDFVSQEQSGNSTPDDDRSSLMLFSPLITSESSTAPPALLPSISGEVDPFADIIGGLGAVTDRREVAVRNTKTEAKSERCVTNDIKPSARTSTSAILDLVWGKTTQEKESSQLAMSSNSLKNAAVNVNRRASSPSALGFSINSVTLPECGASSAVEKDLLSFSPVHTTTPSDPFVGLSNSCIESNLVTSEVDTKIFSLTTTQPTSISAPTSLRGSFVFPYEEVVTSKNCSGVDEKSASPRDPFSKRTTRSSRSLSSSSFVSVRARESSIEHLGVYSSFSASAPATHTVSAYASPSSAPPSLDSSFASTRNFFGLTTSASDDLEEIDPFAEAGLAASNEVPLAEALAAWKTTMDTDAKDESHRLISQDDLTNGIDAFEQQSGSFTTEHETKLATAEEDDWLNAGFPTTLLSDVCDEALSSCGSARNQGDVFGMEKAAEESEKQDLIALAESTKIAVAVIPSADASDDNVDVASLQGEDTESIKLANDQVVGTIDKQFDQNSPTEIFETSHHDSFATSATVISADSARPSDLLSHHDSLCASPSVSDPYQAETNITSRNCNGYINVESHLADTKIVSDNADIDVSGNVDGLVVAVEHVESASLVSESSPWSSSSSPAVVEKMIIEKDASDSFGDFSGSVSTAFAFAQNMDNEDFGDFGDFTQTSDDKEEAFTDFHQSDSQISGEDDDGFSEFAPAVAPTFTMQSEPVLSDTPLSKTELQSFFKEALPVEDLLPSSIAQSKGKEEINEMEEVQDLSTEFYQNAFRSMWDDYLSTVAITGRPSASSSGSLSSATDLSTNVERVRLDRKTTRASKYLKYVLSEKIQEASRQNGIFPHGSERHAMYVGYAASGDADRMRAALKELHEALFQSSVNDAMMRMAKQAALSAKAKIAEQAAQHASSRGGSLFSTTRQLLSRGGSASGVHGSASSGNDNNGDHAGIDTPTSASVQKLARFSLTTNYGDIASSHQGAITGEERGSEGSDHTGHSSESDSEVATSAGDNRTRGQMVSSGNIGLMRKFQDRFSFTSSKNRPRCVNLRRHGQSSDEVRKMELHLDSISGGLDEVKWKCAMFLYDVEEVAHVAPSQISILSYPSKQPLTGKTDRSALTKLVKPHTIWTVDIGANNTDMLNEW